jgi:hypothetical protein
MKVVAPKANTDAGTFYVSQLTANIQNNKKSLQPHVRYSARVRAKFRHWSLECKSL